MSNKPVKTPLGKPTNIGKAAWRLCREVWPDGNVRYFAEIGRPWENRETGATGLIPKMYSGATSDYLRAAQAAEAQLAAVLMAVHDSELQREETACPSEPADSTEPEAA